MAKLRLLLVIIMISSTLLGQDGTLTPELLRNLQTNAAVDTRTQALINAITNTDLKQLALNRTLINQYNDVFSFKLKTPSITDQQSSGRCWLFAAFNVMRPGALKKFNLTNFEYSENYTMFWDKLEKANLFLEYIIETTDKDIEDRELQAILQDPIPDGGWWNYWVNLLEKYGCVPKEIMPETYNSSRTGNMNHILNTMAIRDAVELRQLAQKGQKPPALRQRKKELLLNYYKVLVLHLGPPPEKFTWRYKDKDEKVFEQTYTPSEFYHASIDFNLRDFVTIADHAMYPYNKHYEIKMCRNIAGTPNMDFINLPVKALKDYAFKTLQDSIPIWFAADVGIDMDREKGIMASSLYDYESLLGFDLDVSKADRLRYRHSIPGHAMALIGVDIRDNQPQKWLVENSWGGKVGKDGYWIMQDDWFNEYVFVVIVPNKYLAPEHTKLLEVKPTVLPAWDPLRQFLN